MKRTRRLSSGTRQALASQDSKLGFALRLGSRLGGRLLGSLRGLDRLVVRLLGLVGRGCRALRCFLAFFTFGSFRSVRVPPAASTFSRALAEAECTLIESFFVSSPTPSSFTSLRTERIRPFAFSVSGVTSSPASKRSRSRMFTGWV